MRVLLTDLSFSENTSSFVIGSYRFKDFFWERGSFDVHIGAQVVQIDLSDAKTARKAILKYFSK
jgi:hypothetical protein